jgi:hypothetical protein
MQVGIEHRGVLATGNASAIDLQRPCRRERAAVVINVGFSTEIGFCLDRRRDASTAEQKRDHPQQD